MKNKAFIYLLALLLLLKPRAEYALSLSIYNSKIYVLFSLLVAIIILLLVFSVVKVEVILPVPPTRVPVYLLKSIKFLPDEVLNRNPITSRRVISSFYKMNKKSIKEEMLNKEMLAM